MLQCTPRWWAESGAGGPLGERLLSEGCSLFLEVRGNGHWTPQTSANSLLLAAEQWCEDISVNGSVVFVTWWRALFGTWPLCQPTTTLHACPCRLVFSLFQTNVRGYSRREACVPLPFVGTEEEMRCEKPGSLETPTSGGSTVCGREVSSSLPDCGWDPRMSIQLAHLWS